jgi:hypothetical protein
MVLSSITARTLRLERRQAGRPVVDVLPKVSNPITGRMLLAHGSTHRKLMVAGKMELPGGYNIADNLLVRGDAEGTSISIPVAYQMYGATGELLNDGKTFTRTLTFTFPTGKYLSSAEGREILKGCVRTATHSLAASESYKSLSLKAFSIKYEDGVEFQYGDADMPVVDLAAIRIRGGGRVRYANDDDASGRCVIDGIVRRLAAVAKSDHTLGRFKKCGRSYFIGWFENNLKTNLGRPWCSQIDDRHVIITVLEFNSVIILDTDCLKGQTLVRFAGSQGVCCSTDTALENCATFCTA